MGFFTRNKPTTQEITENILNTEAAKLIDQPEYGTLVPRDTDSTQEGLIEMVEPTFNDFADEAESDTEQNTDRKVFDVQTFDLMLDKFTGEFSVSLNTASIECTFDINGNLANLTSEDVDMIVDKIRSIAGYVDSQCPADTDDEEDEDELSAGYTELAKHYRDEDYSPIVRRWTLGDEAPVVNRRTVRPNIPEWEDVR